MEPRPDPGGQVSGVESALPKFGIRLGDCAELPPTRIHDLVRAARDYGMDSFWFPEHYLPVGGYFPSLEQDRNLDPLELLAFIAEPSGAMLLGTAVVLAPFHHPVQLAKRLSTLAHLTGGRVILGVGVGWAAEEFSAFDVDRRKRGERTDELLAILRQLLAGRPVEVVAHHFRVRVPPHKTMRPTVIPVWGAGGGMPSTFPQVGDALMSTAVANRIGGLDGWITRPTTTAAILRRDRDRLEALNPDVAKGAFTIANVNFGLISTAARPLPRTQVEAIYASHFGALRYEEIADTPYLIGPTSNVLEKVLALKEAGATHFICHMLDPDPGQITAWAEVADMARNVS